MIVTGATGAVGDTGPRGLQGVRGHLRTGLFTVYHTLLLYMLGLISST